MLNDATQKIQRFQAIKQLHRDKEMQAAMAKNQAETYKLEIEKMLASEGVTSIEEIKTIFLTKVNQLSELTSLKEQEVEAADAIFTKMKGSN